MDQILSLVPEGLNPGGVVLAIVIPYFTALASWLATRLVWCVGCLLTKEEHWYEHLRRPNVVPAAWEGWVFGVTWSLVWIAQGIASWIVYAWTDHDTDLFKACAVLYGLELFFQFLWPLVFFGFQSVRGGMLVCIMLMGVTIALVVLFFQVSEYAGWPVVVLLVWVAFATFLNLLYFLLYKRAQGAGTKGKYEKVLQI